MPAPVAYAFGPFTLDPATFRLWRGATEVPLTPKAFELLALLVRERRRALTKQELFDAVWPDTAVTENTLTQRIKEIREALGDSAQEPIYVRTVPRVGFQFVCDVVDVHATSVGESATAAEPQSSVLNGPVPGREAQLLDQQESNDVASAAHVPRRLWIAAGAIAVVAIAAVLVYAARRNDAAQNGGPSNRRVMLAILPFENLTGDAEQQYFGDGLTEEMIAELGRLDPTHLGVIARTSVMSYQATTKNIAEIARELGVDFVLEGSFRREANRVRIVAQLIRATDQTHIWAERYDRDVSSILSLQSELARTIARQALGTLSVETEGPSNTTVSVHPDAFQAYLKGRFFLNRRTADAIQTALEQFQQAILVEPQYAQAYAGLADAHELMASYVDAPTRASFERATAAARRAIALEPHLSEAHASLGLTLAGYAWQWEEAEKAYTRALDLNPSNALAHKGYGELLSFIGRHDEAVAEARRALELDPLSVLMHANLAIIYHRARRSDEALKQIEQALHMDPHYMLAHLNLGLILAARTSFADAAEAFQRASAYSPEFMDARGLLAYAYAKAGRHSEARAVDAEAQRLSARRPMSGYVRAHYYLALGDTAQALTELERAHKERSWQVGLLKIDPLLDELRPHPRFQALLQRMQFPD